MGSDGEGDAVWGGGRLVVGVELTDSRTAGHPTVSRRTHHLYAGSLMLLLLLLQLTSPGLDIL